MWLIITYLVNYHTCLVVICHTMLAFFTGGRNMKRGPKISIIFFSKNLSKNFDFFLKWRFFLHCWGKGLIGKFAHRWVPLWAELVLITNMMDYHDYLVVILHCSDGPLLVWWVCSSVLMGGQPSLQKLWTKVTVVQFHQHICMITSPSKNCNFTYKWLFNAVVQNHHHLIITTHLSKLSNPT